MPLHNHTLLPFFKYIQFFFILYTCENVRGVDWNTSSLNNKRRDNVRAWELFSWETNQSNVAWQSYKNIRKTFAVESKRLNLIFFIYGLGVMNMFNARSFFYLSFFTLFFVNIFFKFIFNFLINVSMSNEILNETNFVNN